MNNYTTTPKWRIGNYIRTLLKENDKIKDMVGENIYPLIAPENVKGDFILYYRGRYSNELTKMGVSESECTIYVIVVSDNYDNSVALAEAIDQTLTGQHFDEKQRIIINLEDSSEQYQDLKFVQTLLFRIK